MTVETLIMVLGAAMVLGGGALVATAVRARRRRAGDLAGYLRDLDGAPPDEFEQRLAEPLLSRIFRPLGAGMAARIAALTPANYLDRTHHRILHAGLAGSLRADEFVTAQALATGLGIVLALAWFGVTGPPTRLGVLGLLLLPGVGAGAPLAWLNRRVAERSDSIRRDLPEVLDLLAISVEAGSGFEGALEVVCRNFDSPLGDELSRTLKEMELGLPRREALHNLKRRTEVPELSNFVLVLTQADALGMPIGRVLKTQATEMRLKRRQWAREKAAKLPVKILFPLVLFIFPAVLVVLLGPAGASIARNL